MAFTDDFTGTSGQVLSARTGWSLLYGTECLQINSSNQLTKISVGTTQNVYFRTDDGSLSQTVKVDFLNTATTLWPFVLGTGTSTADFNCYILRVSTATVLRLYRVTNGVQDASFLTSVSVADLLQAELRATVNGGGSSVSLEIWSHGAQVATFTDTGATRKTAGRRGLAVNTSAGVIPAFDNYSDNYSAPIPVTLTTPGVPFSEGVRNSSIVPVAGTYTGTVATIEGRLMNVDSGGTPTTVVPGFDWATRVASPSGNAYSFNFTGVPVGGPYRVQTRDSAVPANVATGAVDRYVGHIVVGFGQSQHHRLQFSYSGLTVTSSAKVFALQKTPKAVAGAPVYSQVTTTSGHGSGLQALANQWEADNPGVPLLYADTTISGQGITMWINDGVPDSGSGETWTSGYTAWSGFVTTMLAAVSNRWTANLWFQGTNDVSSGTPTYAANMDTLAGLYDSAVAFGATLPLHIVMPHPRSDDFPTDKNWLLRNIQYTKSISGGRWRFGGWLLDWEMDGNGSPHQSPNAAGNPRGGTRIGRALAKVLFNTSLDTNGPQIASAQFDAARTYLDITYDRNIKLADGTTYSGTPITLPTQFAVSTDSGSTFSTILTPGHTSQMTGLRTIRLTKTGGGTWPAGTTRIDYLRATPYSGNTAQTTEYVGAESTIEAGYLSKAITDATTFDGSRGMPASPIMGTGFAVANASAISVLATRRTFVGGRVGM